MQLWAEINGAVDAFGGRCLSQPALSVAGPVRGSRGNAYLSWRVEDTCVLFYF